jgi:hypothetical protein
LGNDVKGASPPENGRGCGLPDVALRIHDPTARHKKKIPIRPILNILPFQTGGSIDGPAWRGGLFYSIDY